MPEKDTWYEITLATEGLPVHRIRAAYVSVDERLYPGWTLLKDETQNIRALVRSDSALIIKRADDPAPALKSAPSPAAVAVSVGRSATPSATLTFNPPTATSGSVNTGMRT